MKRIIALALLLAATFALAGLGQSEGLVVAIDQTTGDQWEAVADSFQQVHGVVVEFRSYSQSSLPTQISVQSYRSSMQFHLAMVPEGWAPSLSQFLVNLSSLDSTLRSRGVVPITSGGRVLGVPIPFADGWFLGVVEWPADQQLAIEFLVATATGETSNVASGVKELGVLPDYGKEKIARANHNPMLDGSLEALLGVAQQALGTIATQIMSALPSEARVALDGLADLYGIPFSSTTSRVTVVLESSPGRSNASNVSALSALGVSRSSIESTSGLIKITVPLSQLSDIVGRMTGVAFIRPPYVPFPLGTTSQGVAAIGAAAFHTAGNRGSGVKIAIIDLGFSGLSQAQASGDLPYSVNQNDLTGTGLTSGITHGTAVAEIVHDVAPDAQLYLIKIADEVDLDLAVTYCLNSGIDIINHSLGWYNTNFYDGTGTVADIASRAIAGGSLWVNAAGNEAESHWEGTFSDGNADGWLDQNISFYTTAGSQIVQFLTWNDWPQASSDYDLYLFDPASNLVASSTKHQTGTEEPTESIWTTAPMSGTYTIRIQGVGSRKLELFNLYQSLSPVIASSSILAPANVAEVIAVGAIGYSQYTTGPQQPYSSQGPTNDGRTKPDLCAPDNVATGTAPYTTFPGSSGAAPHAAGAAALLLAQNPTLSESALRTTLLSQTIPMGSANIYGNGRLYLQTATPTNQPPTALFSISPASGQPGDWFQFNASASQDPDGSIVGYAWEYGDGASGTGVTSYHAYAGSGVYTARLTVTDDDGATATITHTVSVGAPANQPPTAAFTISPPSGPPGTWFSFNASGSQDVDGSIVGYAWEYGDGASGANITSYHSYAAAGTYTVQLTVTDDDGATATTTHTVSVGAPSNQPPTATFTVSPSSGSPGTWFIFDASGSQDVDGSIVSYNWQYGDGTTDSGITPHHTYASAASYTVRLTVTDNNGASDTTTRTVVVQTAAMPDLSVQSVTFTPSGPSIGQTLTFTITLRNSGPASAGQFRVRLQGSASSTQTYVTSLASGASRTLTLSLPLTTSPETFTVTADDLGQVSESNESNNTRSTTATATLPVNQPPNASFTISPTSPTPGAWVLFNASGSSDPDGSIVSYSWNYGDGTSGSGITSQHAYGIAGTYTARLTVIDNAGASDTVTRQISVQVAAQPDLIVQGITFSPPSPSIGSSITVSATIRNVGAAAAGMFRVRLQGAASSTQTYVTQLAAGAGRSISLALPLTTSPETFTLTADDLGQVAESNEGNNTAAVTVTAAAPNPPTANPGGPYSGQAGSPIPFNGTGSTGSISGYSWMFGDGATATGATPSHTYGSPGTYTVSLTVTGPGGQTTASTYAVVSPVAELDLAAELSLPKATYQVGEDIVITITLNRSAYVYLCDVSPDGTVTLLYPNGVHSSNQLALGEYEIPGESAPYTFGISEPTGTETLYLFAATGPIPGFPTTFNGGFVTLSDDPDAFRNGILATMQSQFASGDRAFDSLTFTVSAPRRVSGPDLVIRNVSYTPHQPSIGQTVTFAITVANVGTLPMEMYRLRLLGSTATAVVARNLPAGGQRTLTLSMPLTTSPEIFTVAIQPEGDREEADETNNEVTVHVP